MEGISTEDAVLGIGLSNPLLPFMGQPQKCATQVSKRTCCGEHGWRTGGPYAPHLYIQHTCAKTTPLPGS